MTWWKAGGIAVAVGVPSGVVVSVAGFVANGIFTGTWEFDPAMMLGGVGGGVVGGVHGVIGHFKGIATARWGNSGSQGDPPEYGGDGTGHYPGIKNSLGEHESGSGDTGNDGVLSGKSAGYPAGTPNGNRSAVTGSRSWTPPPEYTAGAPRVDTPFSRSTGSPRNDEPTRIPAIIDARHRRTHEFPCRTPPDRPRHPPRTSGRATPAHAQHWRGLSANTPHHVRAAQ
jgi:hypothetical protein